MSVLPYVLGAAAMGALLAYKSPKSAKPDIPKNLPGSGDGLAWAKTLPPRDGVERDRLMIEAIERGMARVSWAAIELGPVKGYSAVLPVMARTLRIGKTNPIRMESTYVGKQAVADFLGGAMVTPLVADTIFAQAKKKILPYEQRPDWVCPPPRTTLPDGTVKCGARSTMGDTPQMIQYSQDLDRLVPIDYEFLTANEGKFWVVAKRIWSDPDKKWNPATMTKPSDCWGPNYGWFSAQGTPVQSVGMMHNMLHFDYSQEIMLMSQWMVVTGPFPLGLCHVGAILAHPVLSALLSNEGPLPDCKHPFFGPPTWPKLTFDPFQGPT